MSTRTFNATAPQVDVEQSTTPDTFNKYAELPPIKELAEWVCLIPGLRSSVCGYVSSHGPKYGYGREHTGEDSRMAKRLRYAQEAIPPMAPSIPGINAAIEHSNKIADEFEQELLTGIDMLDLAGRFTAAISEAVVHVLLCKSRRAPGCTIPDAFVREGRHRVNARNIDFFYCPHDDPPVAAEAYECKNDPSRVFSEVMGLEAEPNDEKRREWRESKLYLMERLRCLLDAKDISTHLGIISLHRGSTVRWKLQDMARQVGVAVPGIVAVYAREDVFEDILNCRQQPIWSTAD